MSWDISINCSHCGHEVYDRNITYNVSKMYYHAFRKFGHEGGLRTLHKMMVSDAEPILEKIYHQLHKHPEIYEPMNPENGWGSYEGATKVIKELWDKSKELSEGTIYIS
jgi:hypothetical protein